MPLFSNARHIAVNGGLFADVQGNVVSYNIGSMNETGITQLAKEISESITAFHDSAEHHPPPEQHPEAQNLALAHILEWIEGDNNVLWLHGPAGVGKSAIAQTVAEHRAQSKELAASFFFSRDKPGCSTARLLWATIAFQLAISIPALRTKIGGAVEEDPTICQKSHLIQLQKLIIDPFTSMKRKLDVMNTLSRLPFLIIIDGLNECKSPAQQSEVLRSVAHIINSQLPLRFLITSRPEHHIRSELDSHTLQSTCSRILHSEIFPPEHDVRWQAFRSASGSRWKPFFDSDMSPTPIFIALTDNIFSYLDSSKSGFLSPEVFSRFLDESGCPLQENVWKSTSNISQSLADKIIKETYDVLSIDYIPGQRAQEPQASASLNPSFDIFNLNQSRAMPSFTAFSSSPVPLLTRKGFLDLSVIGALRDPSRIWRAWKVMLKKYDLPQYKGWGDLPRDVLPDLPDQMTKQKVADSSVFVKTKIQQELTAARIGMISAYQNNVKQMLGNHTNQSFFGRYL